jgi:hypothetical protein
MSKTIKNTFLAAMATAVLCAGTVSARQLRQASTVTVCNSTCTKKVPCSNVSCTCFISSGERIGTCLLVAAKPEK